MRTRREYDQAFQLAREVIASWDPYFLIKNGGPSDVFDDQVARLLPRLQVASTGAEAAAAVSLVFGEAFGESRFHVAACAEVGEQLYSRLKSAGLLASSLNPAALQTDR
jgi:hypothetical protein